MNELFSDLQKRIALAKQTKEYNNIVYRQAQQSEYSNYTTLESEESGNVSELNSYIAPPSLIKEFKNAKTPAEEKQEFQYNLQKLFSPSDSVSIMSNAILDDEMIKTTNQFFNVFSQQVENVKFGSVGEVVNYIQLFVDKLLNRVNVNRRPANIQPPPVQPPPVIQAPPVIQPPPTIQPPPVTQPPPVQAPPVQTPPPLTRQPSIHIISRECQELVDEIKKIRKQHVNDVIGLTLALTQYIGNVLLTDPKTLTCSHAVTKQFFEQIQTIFYRNDPTQQLAMKNEIITAISQNRSTAFKHPVPASQPDEYYGNLFYSFCMYWVDKYPIAKVVKSYGLMRKPYKKVRYGNGLKAQEQTLTKPKGNQGKKPLYENYVKGHLYLDVTKLNQNVLCIKYTKTANKKTEIAITDNTKLCILQMLTNQFNFSVYERLTDAERKIVGYLNSILHLVDEKLLPNPIDELYTHFNILRGEIEASNDNPIIKSNLKVLAFELHKFGKINSAQLRNVIFELSA